ncbi:hypothetical protein TraAM80_04442 [Trypanosoma rangeli]|uniref:Uncharacterized protein n=1 Tax=Trypanosoma rangeli TaxID=5698 RepID=A0A3R7KFM9_TRYRA|nr:uncharacterized protein TraAM80_04442 [Trypanosoma rangeli]RNF05520.1 hypothetical protein TraAM80_04442 [Trypanosoma rangeli]|eukprot:RNF05520.1 hypothetical protein TraAM80_04442 [Trypanosoma rangeli]
MTPVSERLVLQLVKLRQRDEEVERERALLREREEHRVSLQERLARMQEQLQKVESVRSTLEELNRAEEQKYEQARKEDEKEREKLSESLRVAIDTVNAYSEEVMQLEAKSQHENTSLKEQLEIYAKYHSTGEDKYREIMQARETEYAKIESKRDADVARKPQLEKELAEEIEGLEAAHKEHAQLQEKVNGWLTYLEDIQKRLLKARGSFESAKSEKERQLRRIYALESDRQQMISRAEKSKAERDKEHAKVMLLEEKINTQKKQTEKLLAVAAMLEGGGEKEP